MRRGFGKNSNGRCGFGRGMGQGAGRGFGGAFRGAGNGLRRRMNGAWAAEASTGIEPDFPARYEERVPGMGRGMGSGFAKGGGFGRRFNQGRFPDENEKKG